MILVLVNYFNHLFLFSNYSSLPDESISSLSKRKAIEYSSSHSDNGFLDRDLSDHESDDDYVSDFENPFEDKGDSDWAVSDFSEDEDDDDSVDQFPLSPVEGMNYLHAMVESNLTI